MDRLVLWLAVSLLYMFASVHFQMKWRNYLPMSVIMAYFTFGAGLFFIINTRAESIGFIDPIYLEYSAVVTLIIAWAFGFASVKVYVNTMKNLGLAEEEIRALQKGDVEDDDD